LGDFFPFIHFNFLYDSGFFNDRCLKSITSTSHVYPFYSELIIILSNYLKLEPNIMFSYPYSCEFEDITYLGCLRDYYVFCEGDLHDLKGNLIYSSLILLDSPLVLDNLYLLDLHILDLLRLKEKTITFGNFIINSNLD